MRQAAWSILILAAVGGCSGGGGSSPAPGPDGTFRAIEQGIFATRCLGTGCHAGASPAGGLALEPGRAYESLVGVPASRRPERPRVAPGNPEGSYLLERLVPGGDTPRMPAGGAPLSEAEVEKVRVWIREGAER